MVVITIPIALITALLGFLSNSNVLKAIGILLLVFALIPVGLGFVLFGIPWWVFIGILFLIILFKSKK
jgi:hypothetical protein